MFKFWKGSRKSGIRSREVDLPIGRPVNEWTNYGELSKKLDDNLELIRKIYHGSSDVVFREFSGGTNKEFKMAVIYIDGLVDKTLINDEILKSIMLEARAVNPNSGISKREIYQQVLNRSLTVADVYEEKGLKKVLLAIASGDAALLIDGYDTAICVSARGWESRGVQEPSNEAVVRGPRDGFTETLRFNTALLRRRLRDPNLVIKSHVVGRRTQTDVVVVYLQDMASPKIVKEVEKRLELIDVDGILESGYIEQLIEDDWKTPFPQIQYTERPDSVAGNLLEGKVVIMVDNTPYALIVPAPFVSFFQSPEDYYQRWMFASFSRWIRVLSTLITLTLPALYIALSSFHPGMIPARLVSSMAAAHEGVPFPAFVEALLMTITLELLMEAGIRLPGPIGQTVSIVGGLVIGDAAVSANLVSPLMVIVVALTAISSFTVPNYNMNFAIRVVRLAIIFAAAILGLLGIVLMLLLLVTHLVSLKSFGVGYMEPFAPFKTRAPFDTFVRAPLPFLKTRPLYPRPQQTYRNIDHRNDTEQGEVTKKTTDMMPKLSKQSRQYQDEMDVKRNRQGGTDDEHEDK